MTQRGHLLSSEPVCPSAPAARKSDILRLQGIATPAKKLSQTDPVYHAFILPWSSTILTLVGFGIH